MPWRPSFHAGSAADGELRCELAKGLSIAVTQQSPCWDIIRWLSLSPPAVVTYSSAHAAHSSATWHAPWCPAANELQILCEPAKNLALRLPSPIPVHSSDAAPGASIPQGLVGAEAASRGGRTIAVEGGELSRIHPIHPLFPDSVQLLVPAWAISVGSEAGRVSGICPASSSDAVGCQGTVPSAELVL